MNEKKKLFHTSMTINACKPNSVCATPSTRIIGTSFIFIGQVGASIDGLVLSPHHEPKGQKGNDDRRKREEILSA
jgi:hypothetical protein